MKKPLAFPLLLVALVACSTPASVAPTATPSGAPMLHVAADAAVDGPGITIAEALAQPGEPLLVNGTLLIDPDGTAWLCSALAESFPPQCGGERLMVVDLENAGALPELQSGNGVRWSEGEVRLFGTVTSA